VQRFPDQSHVCLFALPAAPDQKHNLEIFIANFLAQYVPALVLACTPTYPHS
jgi:hypothetical protein